jgi:opacity protein-like surface antigen
MRYALRWIVAVAVMTLLVPSVAVAENFYVAVRGGPGWTPDTVDGGVGFEDAISYKTGFTGSGAVGYAFPFGLRVEGEFGFVSSPLDKDSGIDVGGSVKSYLLMANAYYDLRLAVLGPFRPYVGFGIGGARVNYDHEFINSVGLKASVDDWRTAFAYQARAGVIYDVNRWLDLSLGYRYVNIDKGHIEQGPTHRRVNFDHVQNHSVEFGFAIKF